MMYVGCSRRWSSVFWEKRLGVRGRKNQKKIGWDRSIEDAVVVRAEGKKSSASTSVCAVVVGVWYR